MRALLLEVSHRIRSMATTEPVADAAAAADAVAVAVADAVVVVVVDVMKELELLELRIEERRKQVAAETRRHLADLEELHNANRLVTVGTLTVGLAHEFGTPLGVVLARSQMIMNDDVDLAEARKDAGEIIRQVSRMTQMCREVLDYARPKPPAKVAIDAGQVARQMIALLALDARKRNAKLTFADDAVAGLVMGDPSKLMQVFTNLIINAAQSMPKGGTVTVGVERKLVRPPDVEGLPEAEYVCISVKDTGTGIAAADLAHLFETFFTTRKESEGTGLGLAVSHRIAREHAGWIGVETEEGKGSTFTVYLPGFSPAPN
ncbi:MAG: ATP-binding protein [Deltaproteobacteria bacterium]|nr:ATP-binding protein [Deltaproteobacteria bacterium]